MILNCYRDGFLEKPKTKTTDAKALLEVEAGTNGYQGGDAGHGCTTYFRIEGHGDACIEVDHNHDGFEVALGGDWELSAIIEALEFIVETLKEQSKEEDIEDVLTGDEDFENYINWRENNPISFLEDKIKEFDNHRYGTITFILNRLLTSYIDLELLEVEIRSLIIEKYQGKDWVLELPEKILPVEREKRKLLKQIYKIYKDLVNEHHQS